jgi:long-subunit fatty acid transport protein
MQKPILTGVIGMLCAFSSYSQNDIDAMRYSQTTFGGTARFSSMGGSMGALGGDFSSLSTNPAGIGVYKKTELNITPSVFTQATSSTFNDKVSDDRKLNFNIGSIGIVTTYKVRDTTTGWKTLNFGFGYNRSNNFHSRTDARGYNTTSSLLDVFVSNANGYTSESFDGFSTGLAWTTYLINPDTTVPYANFYNHVIPHYGELQHRSTESRGSMGEINFSFGGNYKERFLIGGTLSIVRSKFEEDAVYEETDDKDTIANFKSFKYVQNLNTEGTGVNFKIGVIVKANDWLRLGAAIHTPTAIKLNDDYSSYMESNLDNGIKYTDSSKDGHFDYSLVTPFKFIASAGFIINKMGLLNVEYEYLDYSTAQLYSHPNVFTDVNTTIRSKYTSTGNLRVGGEIRFDPIAFRLGYAMYGSPFKHGENKDAFRSSYTAGIGYRINNFFMDFAYVRTMFTEKNYFYAPELIGPVKNDYKASSFMLTLGVRF